MKKQIKISIIAIILVLGVSISGMAQTLKQLQDSVDDFSKTLAKALPFNSSLGLNWSDAYIGKLVPSTPPHFGVGASFGITTMELPVINAMMENFGYSVPLNIGRMILPAYTAEARIGGIFLPFDLGVKFGYLPPLAIWGKDINFDYLLVGGDIRYKLLDLKLIKISLGAGVNYLRGSISAKVGSDPSIEYDGYTITFNNPEVKLKWQTTSLDFKVQTSFHFFIITPYIGLGGSVAWSKAGYSVDASINNTGSLQDIQDYLNQYGLDGIDISNIGISSVIKNRAFSFRTFGGLSLNLALFRIDFTGLYSFRDKNFGASVGLRFQL